MPVDDSQVKTKNESQFYFDEKMIEWKFKCSQAILHNEQETVLMAINQKDFVIVNDLLHQKKIKVKFVWVIDEVHLYFSSHVDICMLCNHVCMYVCTYVCIYVYVCSYVHIYRSKYASIGSFSGQNSPIQP